ncbi:MAG TPA: FAD-binding oxidoreductase [Patescibacteria group bacterium]|nr:FAD-binding oxidoreductase [Patescibacteria group bacterium]
MAENLMAAVPSDSPYLTDASGFRGRADRVFLPRDEPELIETVRAASEQDIPLAIAGAGTGVTGGRVPLGGWVISMERFTRLEIGNGRARAGAGVSLADLHKAAAATMQFYAPDPTECSAWVGGTLATNASGSRSFRYGDSRRHTLGLRVVLADGTAREWKRGQSVDFPIDPLPAPATTKHTAGYYLRSGMDWVDLFIGSEGTLGIITEAELRLLPAPRDLLTGVVFFPGDDAALDAVDAWRSIDGLRMIEYFDGQSLALLRTRFDEIPPQAGAAILIEQESSPEESDAWLDRLEAAKALTEESWFAANDSDRERFRKFRHALPEMVNDIVRRNGCLKMGSDFAVPVKRNREMLAFYRDRLQAEFPGQFVIFGHIGDAHVHANILPKSGAEAERAKNLIMEFARKAVKLGGTVSAEHGLGKHKRHLLEIQFTAEEIDRMRAVKRRLDPKGLLGRGNLFDL